MTTLTYCCIAGIALVILALCEYVTIGIVVRKFEPQFLELNNRISALENERKAFTIKHNALEGCYRELVKKFDVALEYIKTLIAVLRAGGITPPDLPDGLDLDVDMRCDGENETRYKL